MPVYDAEDIVELRNRTLRRKRRIRFLIFLLVAMTAFTLYVTRSAWMPKIKGIGKHYSTIVNSGKLAEGNFPIGVSEEGSCQLRQTGGKVIVLTDVEVFFYNTDGALMRKHQHAYTNAVLRAADGRALIYEHGGNDMCIEDEEGTLYKKHFSKSIMFARISKEGYAAVVTASDNYDCEINVYDSTGKWIYERKCMEHVNDLCFTDKSGGCVISSIKAENGKLVTTAQAFSFSKGEDKWVSAGLDTFGLEVYGFKDGAFVLGIDACGYIDTSGQISSYYRYDGDLIGGASKGGKSAVIVNNDDRRKYIMALFSDGSSQPLIVELDEPSVDVSIYDGLAYVMCTDEMRAYDFDGSLRSTAAISDSYSGFVRSKDYIFLKGYNKIDRIDYES